MVNARAGREYQIPAGGKAPNSKTIAVVGSGPAGLEFAEWLRAWAKELRYLKKTRNWEAGSHCCDSTQEDRDQGVHRLLDSLG